MLRIIPCVLYREKIELNSLINSPALSTVHGSMESMVHGCANKAMELGVHVCEGSLHVQSSDVI